MLERPPAVRRRSARRTRIVRLRVFRRRALLRPRLAHQVGPPVPTPSKKGRPSPSLKKESLTGTDRQAHRPHQGDISLSPEDAGRLASDSLSSLRPFLGWWGKRLCPLFTHEPTRRQPTTARSLVKALNRPSLHSSSSWTTSGLSSSRSRPRRSSRPPSTPTPSSCRGRDASQGGPCPAIRQSSTPRPVAKWLGFRRPTGRSLVRLQPGPSVLPEPQESLHLRPGDIRPACGDHRLRQTSCAVVDRVD